MGKAFILRGFGLLCLFMAVAYPGSFSPTFWILMFSGGCLLTASALLEISHVDQRYERYKQMMENLKKIEQLR